MEFLFQIFVILFSGAAWGQPAQEETSYCSFPQFLWRESTNNNNRTWFQIVYTKPEIWIKQTEMHAFPSELKFMEMDKIQRTCPYGGCDHGDGSDVITRMRHVICLSEHKGDKFRVKWFDNGLLKFSCMKFQAIGERLLVISQAPTSGLNEHRLCYDDFMMQDNDLWFGKHNQHWIQCPNIGGFDIMRHESDHAISCSTEVNSSRIEFECSENEGIIVTFADPNCNPFPLAGEKNVFNMKCWTQWTRGQFLYLVVGQSLTSSMYTLMLPLSLLNLQVTQLFKFHINPGIHISTNSPGSDAMRSESQTFVFVAKRSDASLCYDDSPHCEKHVTSQNCYGDQVAKNYANFCLKSCGLCELSPSSRPECKFLKELTGRWLFFSSSAFRHLDDVINPNNSNNNNNNNEYDDNSLNHFNTVKYYFDSGTMHVTGRGSNVCKNKHWMGPYYKVLSVLNNGCRPRYFCLNLVKNDIGNLELKTSAPSHKDTSFSLCQFQQEYQTPKVLFAPQNIVSRNCGFSGIFSSEVSFSDGSTTQGIATDFDFKDCSTEFLHVRLEHAPHSYPVEMRCLQLLKVSSESSLLITHGTKETICWIVRRFKPSNVSDASPSEEFQPKPHHRHFHVVRIHCYSVSPITEYFDPLQTFISSMVLLESIEDHPTSHKCTNNHAPKKDANRMWHHTNSPHRFRGHTTNLARPNFSKHHQAPRTGRVRIIESSRPNVVIDKMMTQSIASNLLICFMFHFYHRCCVCLFVVLLVGEVFAF